MFRRKFAIFISQVFPEFAVKLSGINQLNLSLAVRNLVVAEYPDLGGNSGIVKQVVGHLHDGFEPIVLDDVAANIAFATSSIAGKQAGSVVY